MVAISNMIQGISNTYIDQWNVSTRMASMMVTINQAMPKVRVLFFFDILSSFLKRIIGGLWRGVNHDRREPSLIWLGLCAMLQLGQN